MKVKKKGIEVDAVVTRIEEHESIDADGISRDYNYYVRYQTLEGRQIEAALANPKNRLETGSRVKIKYLPVHEDYPVLTEIMD